MSQIIEWYQLLTYLFCKIVITLKEYRHYFKNVSAYIFMNISICLHMYAVLIYALFLQNLEEGVGSTRTS